MDSSSNRIFAQAVKATADKLGAFQAHLSKAVVAQMVRGECLALIARQDESVSDARVRALVENTNALCNELEQK